MWRRTGVIFCCLVLLILSGSSSVAEEDLYKEFKDAAYQSDLVKVKQLYKKAKKLGGFPSLVNAALQKCAVNGHIPVAGFLLKSGATPEGVSDNFEGITALMVSAENGQLEFARFLLNQGSNVNAMTTPRKRTVHRADDPDKKIMKTSFSGKKTALMYSAANGHVELMTLLLERGAEIDAKKILGQTALNHAIRAGQTEAVRVLLKFSASMTIATNDGFSALASAASNGNIDIVELLLNHGADVNVQDRDGWTPLLLAASKGYLNIVKTIATRGGDISAHNRQGYTALHLAAIHGFDDLTEYLLGSGCSDINAGNSSGYTLLMLAAQKGNLSTVTKLLEHKADLEVTTSNGFTALSRACQYGHTEVVSLFLQKGAKLEQGEGNIGTPLLLAASNGHADIVELLLQKGARPDAVDKHGANALIFAAEENYSDIVQTLILKGSDVNHTTKQVNSALMFACRTGAIEPITLLADHGAALDAKNDQGRPPLFWAAIYGNYNVVRFLLQKGLDPKATYNNRILSSYGDYEAPKQDLKLRAASLKCSKDTVTIWTAITNCSEQPITLAFDEMELYSYTDTNFKLKMMKMDEDNPLILKSRGAAVSLHNMDGFIEKITLPPRESIPPSTSDPSKLILTNVLHRSFLKLVFDITDEKGLARMRIRSGGPVANISIVPLYPALTAPRISIGQNSAEVSAVIGHCAARLEQDKPDKNQPWSDVEKVVNDVYPPFSPPAVSFKQISQVSVATDMIWLVVPVMLQNTGSSEVSIHSGNLVLKPVIPESPKDSFQPIGIGQHGEIQLGDPLDIEIPLPAGTKQTIFCLYLLPYTKITEDEFSLNL